MITCAYPYEWHVCLLLVTEEIVVVFPSFVLAFPPAGPRPRRIGWSLPMGAGGAAKPAQAVVRRSVPATASTPSVKHVSLSALGAGDDRSAVVPVATRLHAVGGPRGGGRCAANHRVGLAVPLRPNSTHPPQRGRLVPGNGGTRTDDWRWIPVLSGTRFRQHGGVPAIGSHRPLFLRLRIGNA